MTYLVFENKVVDIAGFETKLLIFIQIEKKFFKFFIYVLSKNKLKYHIIYIMLYIFYFVYKQRFQLHSPFKCTLKKKCQKVFIFHFNFVESKMLGERRKKEIFITNKFFSIKGSKVLRKQCKVQILNIIIIFYWT